MSKLPVPKTIQNALAAALARPRSSTQGTLSAGRAAKSLLVLGSLAASLLLLEIVTAYTGLLVPSEFADRHTMLHEFFEPDPELGFKTRADLKHFLIRWRETGVEGRYTTDAFGFRNAGRDYRQSRLFFVGDSFTWGGTGGPTKRTRTPPPSASPVRTWRVHRRRPCARRPHPSSSA